MQSKRFILGVLGCLTLLSTLPVFAYDEEEAKKVAEDIKEYGFKDVTTKEGLKFRIPSDMPIESHGGLVAPVPFEEYLYIKFKKIEEKLMEVGKKLTEVDKKNSELNEKLTGVDENLKQVDKKIDQLDKTLGDIKKTLGSKEPASVTPNP